MPHTSPLPAARKYAEAVRCVCFAAESVRNEQTGMPLHPVGDPWRLEALMLTEGAMQPWPATLVNLIDSTPDRYRVGTMTAFAGLAKRFHEKDRFGMGARVLAWSPEREEWRPAVVLRKLFAGRCDLRLAAGEVINAVRKEFIVAADAGGPGALLRAAAEINSTALLDALLKKGISVFESDLTASTALHLASNEGHEGCVRLLIEADADAWMGNKQKVTPFDLAVRKGHIGVMRVFQPSAADEDVTAAPPNPGERGVHCWLAALLAVCEARTVSTHQRDRLAPSTARERLSLSTGRVGLPRTF